MHHYLPDRVHLLLFAGFMTAGCVVYNPPSDDPYYPGYHRRDKITSPTTAVPDRSEIIKAQEADRTVSRQDPFTFIPRDSTGQQLEGYNQYNLSYHLYGPYYSRSYHQRPWLSFQTPYYRRTHFSDWRWFDDSWWDIQLFYGYNQGSWAWYDPWNYGYNPWYWYYDPYVYRDPYYYYGSGYYYHSPYYYHGSSTGGFTALETQARPRDRKDWINPAGGLGMAPLTSGMRGVAAPRAGVTTSIVDRDKQNRQARTRTPYLGLPMLFTNTSEKSPNDGDSGQSATSGGKSDSKKSKEAGKSAKSRSKRRKD